MSNLYPQRSTEAGRGCAKFRAIDGRLLGGLIWLVTIVCVPVAHADANQFEAWARFISERREYSGRFVHFPDPAPRPVADGIVLCAERAPVCVHAVPTQAPARVALTLNALQEAYEWLSAAGFALPYPDGGHGGDLNFDLYLVPGVEHGAGAAADAPIAWADFDAAATHALVDSALGDEALPHCALVALTEAALLGQEPAEDEGVRRAIAAFIGWIRDLQFGCDNATEDAQRAPELGTRGARDEQVAAASLWLAMLSQRHDAGTGLFIRDAWDIARQKSEQPDQLHETPTFWQAIAAALEKAGESLDDSAIEFAVARYFAGFALGALPELARVPVAIAPAFAALPKHLAPPRAALATYGSAYTSVDTRGAAPGARLKVWLRGEPGVRWSLVAVRLDANGHELGRVAAPPRTVPESYIPLELEAGTKQVLLVVTKLPALPLIKPLPLDDASGFRLILDRAEP